MIKYLVRNVMIIFSFMFFLADLAFAAKCSISLERDENNQLKAVTLHYPGCEKREIASFAKGLPIDERKIFGDLVRKSLFTGVVVNVPSCEGGRCAKPSRIPRNSTTISITKVAPPLISDAEVREQMDQFGIQNYTPRQDRDYITIDVPADVGHEIFNASTVDGLVGLGYLVADLKNIGVSLKAQGAMMSYSYDVLVRGKKETDVRANESLALQRQLLLDTIEQSIEAVKDEINRVTETNKSIELEIRRIQTQGIADLDAASSNAAASLASLASTKDTADAIALRITTRPNHTLSELAKTEEEIANLRRGMLPEEAIAKERRNLSQLRSNGQISELAERISELAGMVESTTNDARREQYQGALRSVTDDRGIVSSWALAAGIPGTLKLKTDEWSPAGRALRQVLNETLGHIARGNRDVDLGFVVGILAQADDYLASGNKKLGDRLLNRARSRVDFATSNQRVSTYQKVGLTEEARGRFGISLGNGSYEDYQTARVSNKLAAVPADKYSDGLYLVAAIQVRQLADQQVRSNQLLFNQHLDNAYAVLDFVTGAGMGVVKGAQSMVDGIAQTVSHPIDTAVAIASAIKNYDQTYQVIYDHVAKICNDYPSYSPQQKGEVVGRVTFELASLYVGAGMTKAAGAAALVAAVPEISAVAAELTGVVADAARGLKLLEAYTPAALAGNNIAARLRSGAVADEVVRGGMPPAEVGAIANRLVTSSDDAIRTIGPERYAKIINTPKGQRPLPETYLPKSYIDAHLAKFDDGASRIMRKNALDRYGPAQNDGTAFVLPKVQADNILGRVNGKRDLLEKSLGFSMGDLNGQEMVRVDIAHPWDHGLRIPSGNEAGANELWLPGGLLPNKTSEAILDLGSVAREDLKVTYLGVFQ
jgi:hypothetical protein